MRTPAQQAELALLLEVAGTPKPGNVDRHRDLEDLRFEHFLAGAVGARTGLELAADGEPIGTAFERAVEAMAAQGGDNTQFGALLLLTPLVRAARDGLTRATVSSVCENTTVADAAGFYRAFDHVDVFVDEPPADMEPLDVRRGSEAVPALEERELTLFDVMERSVPGDDDAREWITGFERSFDTADRLGNTDETETLSKRTGTIFLELLAERPDTLVANRRGEDVATSVSERAAQLLADDGLESDPDAVEAFADDLVSRGINPGTTADVTAAGLFIALEREVISV